VCLDIIPEIAPRAGADLRDLLIPGSLVIIGAPKFASGGPVSNVGIPLFKLGIRTAFMGKVGDDLFGKGLRELFKPYGAEGSMAVVPGEVTSYTVVIAPPGYDRIFLHNPGANDTYGEADVDFEQVAQAAHFHLGYPPLMRRLYSDGGDELTHIFARAKKVGATTSLDLAFPDPSSPAGQAPWRQILAKALPHVDIFLPSCEELMYMFDRDTFWALRKKSPDDPVLAYDETHFRFLANEALALGAGIVGLKAGLRGIYVASAAEERLHAFGRARASREFARRELWQSAYRVEAVKSATGAGDNAIAGFLAAFINGMGPSDCLHVAAMAGADNVTQLDATSGIRSWQATVADIPHQTPVEIHAGAEFTFDPKLGLWRGSRDGKGVAH
jgi:sugar/nucleoside kinase (ribokinase family)